MPALAFGGGAKRVVSDPVVTHTAGLLAVLATVIGSWQVLYVPAIRRLETMRNRLAGMHQEIEQLDAMLVHAGGEAAWRARQQEVLDELTRRIPPSHEMPGVLNRLLEQAGVNGLAVVDVNQGNLGPATDDQGTPILLADTTPCLALPVTLTADGSFRNAVMFLEQLTGAGLPALVTVRRVEMTIHNLLTATLRMSFQLVLYAVQS